MGKQKTAKAEAAINVAAAIQQSNEAKEMNDILFKIAIKGSEAEQLAVLADPEARKLRFNEDDTVAHMIANCAKTRRVHEYILNSPEIAGLEDKHGNSVASCVFDTARSKEVKARAESMLTEKDISRYSRRLSQMIRNDVVM
jgi:hypothetical protein